MTHGKADQREFKPLCIEGKTITSEYKARSFQAMKPIELKIQNQQDAEVKGITCAPRLPTLHHWLQFQPARQYTSLERIRSAVMVTIHKAQRQESRPRQPKSVIRQHRKNNVCASIACAPYCSTPQKPGRIRFKWIRPRVVRLVGQPNPS